VEYFFAEKKFAVILFYGNFFLEDREKTRKNLVPHGMLASYGVEQKALKWFDSYLSDRHQKCLVNGELSGALAVTCGVPQGS